MGKLDRAILIFIGVGIWAFVLVQVFQPKILIAQGDDHWHYQFLHHTSFAEEGHSHPGFYAKAEHWHEDMLSRREVRKLVEEYCDVSGNSLDC